MPNLLQSAKKIIREAIYVEKEFHFGVLNQKWSNTALIMWVISIVAGWTLNYLPISGISPLRGFQIDFGGPAPLFITLVALLAYPICMVGLLVCYKKGWIEKDDF